MALITRRYCLAMKAYFLKQGCRRRAHENCQLHNVTLQTTLTPFDGMGHRTYLVSRREGLIHFDRIAFLLAAIAFA